VRRPISIDQARSDGRGYFGQELTMIAVGRQTTDPCAGGAAPRFVEWLSLAAAPTFAMMALLTGSLRDGPLDMLCSAAQHGSPLSGMVAMYLLMSVFHSAPWLKLVFSRGNSALQS
jgi:hypothetical protein